MVASFDSTVARAGPDAIGGRADPVADFHGRASVSARMPLRRSRATITGMRVSYAVVWREGELPQGTGKLELLQRALRLDGVCGGARAVVDVPYEDLRGLSVGRAGEDRIANRSALVFERRSGPALRVASFDRPNLISEIAERVASMQLGGAASLRTAFVVPIEPGSEDAVRELVAHGPPFDPDAAGLDRHLVFLTSNEVVFLFESRLGEAGIETLLGDPAFLESAASWQGVLAGPPRIAEGVYSWTRLGDGFDPALTPPELLDS
jgi:hypothetical protein